jgi:hypothetical protein
MADTKATEGFAGLLTQLDKMGTVSKSMAAADGGKPDDEAAARILAAAAEGKEGEGKEGEEGEGAEGEGEGDGLMGKSFRVKLADGTETDAFDGTEMMKALAVKIEAQDVVAGDFAKAMTAMVDIVNTAQTVIVEQGKLIKSLQADVGKLSSAGTGRRALVNILAKPTTTVAAEVEKPSMNETMAKCFTAQSKGLLNAMDIARVEARLNTGLPVPDDVARVIG